MSWDKSISEVSKQFGLHPIKLIVLAIIVLLIVIGIVVYKIESPSDNGKQTIYSNGNQNRNTNVH